VADIVAMLRLDTRAEASSPVITVQGAVQEPGTYPLTQDMRLQDAISAAISVNKDTWLQAALVVRRDIRNSTISVREVSLLPGADDLSQFKMAPGDTVIAFAATEDRQAQLAEVIQKLKQQATPSEPARIFSINGQVKFPGEYPLVEGNTVQSAIALAGGFTEPAYPYSYEVTRQAVDDKGRFTIKTIDLNLADAGNGQNVDEQSTVNVFALLSRDTLIVRSQPGYQETETIELKGEVRFPGTYRAHRGETLSQVIKRAGGLTGFADSTAAIFTRDELKQAEQRHLDEIQADMAREIARLSVIKAADGKDSSADQQLMLASLSDKIAKLHGIGRLVIDLPGILKEDKDVDVEVRNGDVLMIPGKRQEVIVLGEVNYPTSHRIRPGDSARDYLNRSGGFTQGADGSRVYVIRANGEVLAHAVGWFTSKSVKAGDTIVVPLDLEPIRPIPLLTSLAQIAGQIAITAASLKVIGAF
jgi:protein involved in polysaccharide export with SLBB domain